MIYHCEQGTTEWHELRRGVITASHFQEILVGKKGAESYMNKLIAESLGGKIESFSNTHTARGIQDEPKAKALYEFERDVEVNEIGFCKHDDLPIGCSPDGLVGDDGIIEIKSKKPELYIEWVRKGEFPKKHLAQVQGNLWLLDRQWCDFIAYCEGLPLWIKRIERDEKYIDTLNNKVTEFSNELITEIENTKGVLND